MRIERILRKKYKFAGTEELYKKKKCLQKSLGTQDSKTKRTSRLDIGDALLSVAIRKVWRADSKWLEVREIIRIIKYLDDSSEIDDVLSKTPDEELIDLMYDIVSEFLNKNKDLDIRKLVNRGEYESDNLNDTTKEEQKKLD